MPDRLTRIFHDASKYFFTDSTPLLYFTKTENVGDLVSKYVVERLGGRPVHAARSRVLPHLSAVGSTLGSCSFFTNIWGSGSIDGSPPVRRIDPRKVFALRGIHTLAMVQRNCAVNAFLPLGDPAILMPEFYDYAVPNQSRIGIIPHFDELNTIRSYWKRDDEHVRLIDVRQTPESFINEIRSCSFILSSSLHGLILSDAYDIPNAWISATDKLLGGEWKFFDYYSTTTDANQKKHSIVDASSLRDVLGCVENLCSVKRFSQSASSLKDSFPHRFMNPRG